MTLKLENELVTGVAEIDNQHIELFNRINSLLDACNRGSGVEEVIFTNNFLTAYIQVHFKSEEKLMSIYNYPDKESHIDEHIRFSQNFSSLNQLLKEQGVTDHFLRQTKQLLTDWLIQHIGNVDMSMAKFLRSKI